MESDLDKALWESFRIYFTQYLMPLGKTTEVYVGRSEATQAKANAILAAGYRFHCEMLNDYRTISFTVFDPETEEDVAEELCENGPEIPAAVDRLILGFAARLGT